MTRRAALLANSTLNMARVAAKSANLALTNLRPDSRNVVPVVRVALQSQKVPRRKMTVSAVGGTSLTKTATACDVPHQ